MKIKKFIKNSIIALVAVFSASIFSFSSLSLNTTKAASVPTDYGTKTDCVQSLNYEINNLSLDRKWFFCYHKVIKNNWKRI